MSKIRILTPTFEAGDPELIASFRGMDPGRLQDSTFRLGLLDNTKPNTGLLLKKIGEELSQKGLARSIVSLVKSSAKDFNPASAGASPEIIEQLSEEADFVLTGLGNWGSCTSWSIHDSVELFKKGIPVATICGKGFVPIGKKYAKSLGLEALPIIEVTDEIGHVSPEELSETAKQVANQIAILLDTYRRNAVMADTSEISEPEEIEIETDACISGKLNELFIDRGWSDGLPIVPPTEEKVSAMLKAAHLEGDEILGILLPRGGLTTAKKAAVCAVLAGCDPVQFPIVVAAVHAISLPAFHLFSVQSTAHPHSPFIVVNGPVGKEAGLSDGHDLTPRGWKANLTIARAVRLVCITMAGVKGLVANHTQGYVGRYVDCIRENEAENPWEPYHVELGYPKEASVVTVFEGEPPHLIDDRGSTSPQSLLTTFAQVIATAGNRSIYGSSEQLFLFAPMHAHYLASHNFSKSDVKDFLYEVARVPLHQFPKGNLASMSKWQLKFFSNVSEHVTLPVVRNKQDFKVIVSGGVGPHSMYVPGGLVSRSVTVEVDTVIRSVSQKRRSR